MTATTAASFLISATCDKTIGYASDGFVIFSYKERSPCKAYCTPPLNTCGLPTKAKPLSLRMLRHDDIIAAGGAVNDRQRASVILTTIPTFSQSG
jgi:hypothetical protein